MAIFRFFKMWAADILEVQILDYLTVKRSRASACVMVPNFVTIVQTLLRYGDISIFHNGGRRHLGFLKFEKFNGRKGQEVQTASPCQIWWRSVDEIRRFFFYFYDGGRHYVGFSKFVFNGPKGQECQLASWCQIWWWSVKSLLRYVDFSIFPRWRPSAILDLWCVFGPPTKSTWWSLSVCKIWLEAALQFWRREFQYYVSIAWKCLFN